MQQVIAITSTFTAEPIKESLDFWIKELGLSATVEFAPYNQVFQQLLDPLSLLSTNTNSGVNVLLLRFEDWLRSQGPTIGENGSAGAMIYQTARELAAALREAAGRTATPFLVCICPGSKDTIASGHLSEMHPGLEDMLVSEVGDLSNIYFIKNEVPTSLYLVADYYDHHSDKLGHVPFTPLFFVSLGTMLARKIAALKSPPYKVIVLDCDQTLWKGVCGEDGVWGIDVDEPRRLLQQLIVAQHNVGRLVCLCSKNNEEDVKNVFDARTDMPLKWEHVIAWRINWGAKSENIKSLSEELQLGLDSFVFLDDDPVVCAEVQANCPEVLTLRLPSDPSSITEMLDHIWAFDHMKVTEEDKNRASLYKQNAERDQLRKRSNSYADFLASLNLEVTILEMEFDQIARVSQLTQRTNQFNFTTIRRSESEIMSLCDARNASCQVVKVKDRFGDYGLVGAMIFRNSDDSLEVDTFLLSCRVLGRGVEHRMLAHLGELALERGCKYVDITYLSSAKNRPAFDFLNTVGTGMGQPINNGLLFRFPADQASLITNSVILDEAVSNHSTITKPAIAEVIPPVAILKTRSKLLSRIPGELSKPDQILTAIRSQKQRVLVNRAGDFVATEDEIESELIKIWEEVLSIRPILVSDNFFELGGDSLAAVQLFSAIEEVFGKDFTISTLFQAPTVRQLSALVRRGKETTSGSSLVPIQPNGSRTPFFCVHAGGGNVLFYKDLAHHLGSDQPFYGLQAQGIDSKLPRHTSVEEMAQRFPVRPELKRTKEIRNREIAL